MVDGQISVDGGSGRPGQRALVAELYQQRERLRKTAADIRQASQDISRFRSEGADYAAYAATCAAVIMVTDILKHSMSAMDRRAKLLFGAMDKNVATANKVLKAFGQRQITTREDLLRNLDPDLQKPRAMLKVVEQARAFLKKHEVRETKEVKLLLDLGVAMTEDSLLIMQAGNTQVHVNNAANSAQANVRRSLEKTLQNLILIDNELTRQFEQLETLSRTA
jgi:hypothetical protein